MFRFAVLLWIIGVFASTAKADVYLDLGMKEYVPFDAPKVPAASESSFGLKRNFDPELEKLSVILSDEIVRQFKQLEAPLSGPAPSCETPRSLHHYLEALRISGRFEDCEALAKRCESHKPTPATQDVLIQGAVCAEARFDLEGAHHLYDVATSSGYAKMPHFAGAVYQFGRFAYFTQYQEEASKLLARVTVWSSKEIQLAIASYEYLRNGKTKLATPGQVEAFLETLGKFHDSLLDQRLVIDRAFFTLSNRYQYTEAARFLAANLNKLRDPDEWFSIAYRGLYFHPAPGFRLAARLYSAALPYLHARSALPVEENTVTYSELYGSLCKSHLTRDDDFAEFVKLKFSWLKENAPLADIIKKAEALNATAPGKADLLSFLGSLYEEAGDDSKAAASYWQAHRACPRYNRSHWGLSSIYYRARNRAFSDYAASLARVDRELASIEFPPEIEKYVLNWGSLDPLTQKRFKYAMRFWAPYVRYLQQNGQSIYVKQAFQLLSEAPDNVSARDLRIQGPTYEDDQRLWDDVRGCGGTTVIVDRNETLEGAFGAYNLAGHEVGHQFHFSLPKPLADCIHSLYEGAKARGKFADPYAASNEYEYFAQAVAYSMIPADSPKRFGLNVQWLEDNDPDVLRFLKSIQDAVGDVSKIQCSI